MATSAIGPGFITQSAQFTVQLGAAFALPIVVSVVIDIALQLNVWRIIGASGHRAQELGNRVLPGLGWVVSILLIIGGFVFNIGNIAGAGLGTQAILGLDPRMGATASALIAIVIFLSRRAGLAMDRIVIALGVLMIGLTVYVAVTSHPPVGDAAKHVVLPGHFSMLATTTLLGGTIGGYMIYSGAHRLLDAGLSGPSQIEQYTRGSIVGILVTGVLRVLFFLAFLGVVAGGAHLATSNQAASAFQTAAGQTGLRLFGIVYWAAAISSVIGAAFTSVSFVTSRTQTTQRTRTVLVVAFTFVTTALYVSIGTAPTTVLVLAGAFNGVVLPIGVGMLLWVGWRRSDLLQGYRYPRWLLILGTLAWLTTIYFAVNSIIPMVQLFSA